MTADSLPCESWEPQTLDGSSLQGMHVGRYSGAGTPC